MKIQTFIFRSTIPRPSEEVFGWHLRPGALERSIPPWKDIQVLSPFRGPAIEGSQIVFRVKWGPFWKNWVFEHRDFKAGNQFSNAQIEGPFSFCEHYRRVKAQGAICSELEDQVEYAFPCSFFNPFIKKELSRSFSWLHARLAKDLMTYARYPSKSLRILLSGSSGLIGKDLMAFLQAGGHQVIRLVRRPVSPEEGAIFWDPKTEQLDKEQFENFDAVIHLAGENIGSGRWTQEKKEAFFSSRCRDTWLLSHALSRLRNPPKTFICASAVGFFGNRDKEPLTEGSSQGKGFIADLCAQWEQATRVLENRGTRVVHARFGYVLSPKGGMLRKMMPAFQMGLGGKLGSGQQIMPWITLDDVIGAVYHVMMEQGISGAVNIVSPHPVTQAEFSKTLAKTLHRPWFFHLPARLLRCFFGEMADELLLTSENVIPERLLQTGYVFRYPHLSEALRDLLALYRT